MSSLALTVPSETTDLLPKPSTTSRDGSTTVAPPGFLTDVTPMTLAWHNIKVYREKPTKSLILDNINGLACPKQVVALMGASGAGKTTLLNALMGRNLTGLEVTGDVFVGGSKEVPIGDVSGYVQQDELFVPTLTVNEHLMIQAGLRLSGYKKSEIKLRVDELIDELGLKKCRHSKIGLSGIKKGLSGGEIKRLMVASVLLDNPSILFLDEPTTGLDSHMAQQLMNSLNKLAAGGRTVVATIHQPSSKIFNMLDVVIFLGDGLLSYMGPPNQAVNFFDSLGFVCPDDYNPADYIIDILAIDRQNNNEEVALERIHKIAKAFTESEMTKEFNAKIRSFEGFGDGFVKTRKKASFFTMFFLILKRSLISNKRNPAIAKAKMSQKVIMGLFCGLLYYKTELTERGVANFSGALFFIVAELTYSTLFGILACLPHDFPLLVREHFDGLYSVSAYYFARVLSYMPIFVLDGVMLMSICYWMIGFTPYFQQFIMAVGIALLVEQSAAAFGVMLSTICPSYVIAISVAGPIMTILSLTGGMYANVEQIPAFIRWTQHLSWFKYGFEALMINQWKSAETYTNNMTVVNSTKILSEFAFHEDNFWQNLGIMGIFIMGFYLIGYIGLYIRVHRNR